MSDGSIIIVAYNDAARLREALLSCCRWAARVPVIVVDNASTDATPMMVDEEFPEVRLLRHPHNRGYGGGCNAGIAVALEEGAEWIMLLNQDAMLTAGALERLEAFLRATPSAAAVQPAIMRPDSRCNSLGNPQHFLGFSFAGGNGATVTGAEDDPALPWLCEPRWRDGVQIPVISGAAVMLRPAALRDAGGFETALFLYHEDFELSLRLRERGWTLHLLGGAEVVHDHTFARNPGKWYHLERNRHWVLLVHYRWRTLLTLTAPLLAAEMVVWTRALKDGWAPEKLRSYVYWLDGAHRRHARRRRRWVQTHRLLGDRAMLAGATTVMSSGEGSRSATSVLFDRVAAAAWRTLRPLIR